MKSLADLFNKHPQLRILNPNSEEDNQKILKFFDSHPMKNERLELVYLRSPNYFRFLELHSKTFYVFVVEIAGEIKATGTLLIRDGIIDGKNEKVGYLGDLRVNQSLKVSVIWRNFYQDLIQYSEKIPELFHLKYFNTVIIDENNSAINALVKSTKVSFQYKRLSKYQMINIWRKKPFKQSKKLKGEIVPATHISRIQLERFLSISQSSFQFGYQYNDKNNELTRRLNEWGEDELKNMYVYLEHGKILFYTHLWHPSPHKKITIKVQSKPLKTLLNMVSIVSTFPKSEEELKILYCSQLSFGNLESKRKIEIFHFFLHYAFEHQLTKGYHFISFDNHENRSLEEALLDFYFLKTRMALYQVHHKESTSLILSENDLSFFEMALV